MDKNKVNNGQEGQTENYSARKRRKALLVVCLILIIIAIIMLAAIFVPKDNPELSNDPLVETSEVTPSEETENINGINVSWSKDCSEAQKIQIRNLLENMVHIEGGTFTMGTNWKNALDDERPVHKETVRTFLLNKYEVPQSLWLTVMGTNPSYFKGENLPVENVSHDDCLTFIERLNLLTGQQFRLPTEAEWEYAAGGGLHKDAFMYSGSDNADEVSWYRENAKSMTHEVGSKHPNSLGLYNMSGNVSEWTSDIASGNYDKPREGSHYIKRGGSWNLDAWNSRVTRRDRMYHKSSDGTLGLRLAL